MNQHGPKRLRAVAVCTVVAALALGTASPALASDSENPELSYESLASLQNSDVSKPTLEDLRAAAEATNATGKWFVQLTADATSQGGRKSAIVKQQRTFTAEMAASDEDVEVTNSFVDLWNGVTVDAGSESLDTILNSDQVEAVFPVVVVERPDETATSVSSPDMYTAKSLTGADYVQQDLGVTGAGIKIGIIDTGVDIDNPVLGGTGVSGESSFPTTKVVAGYDLVGDDYNADDPDTVRVPDSNPDDCAGHGTHVAGIAAGNNTPSGDFTGVAPDAVIGAYRVFGCDGTTDSDVMLEAMELAAADGMDVVNMSIGAAAVTWPNYPTAVAANNLASAGVVVTVSQGNEGDSGLFFGGAPAVASGVIAVGSVDNTTVMQSAFSVGGVLYGYAGATGSPAPAKSGDMELAAYPAGQETGAVDLDGEPFAGKAVLVSRGTSSFYEKALAAQKDGAAAVIIYNNAAGVINATVEGDEAITIPVVTITQAAGQTLASAIAAGSTTLSWTDQYSTAQDPNGGITSDFSSWGVAADLSLKPNVMAPGGNIFSAYPLDAADGDGSGFTSMSGTSMAAPHVAGAAALLLSANAALTPTTVKTLLQNTATPVANSIGYYDFYEPIVRQGAGLIDVASAVSEAVSGNNIGTAALPSTITPSEISLGDSDAIETTPVTITNNKNYAVTYDLVVDDSGLSVALGANADANDNYDIPQDLASVTTITLDGTPVDHVAVGAGASVTVDVTVNEPTESWLGDAIPDGTFYGAWLTFAGDDGTVRSVPFMGLKGDYETDLTFMLSTYADLYPEDVLLENNIDPSEPYYEPTLAYAGADGYDLVEDTDHVYSMEGDDILAVALHIENPVSHMSIQAYSVDDAGNIGAPLSSTPLYESDGEGTSTGYQIPLEWDGTYVSSDGTTADAPSGRYVLGIEVTKGLGQASTGNDADNYESWTSPVFVVREYTAPEPGDEVAPVSDSSKGINVYFQPDLVTTVTDLAMKVARGDQVLAGDWDGDGYDTLAVRKGRTYTFYDTNRTGATSYTITYGPAGSTPVVGDFNGDGRDDLAVRAKNTNRFYINYDVTTGGVADKTVVYGKSTDIPLAGDWNGDGTDTLGVKRGNKFLLVDKLGVGTATRTYVYGKASDKPLVADFNGDSVDSISVVRGATVYVNNALTGGTASSKVTFGRSSSQLVTGDWDASGSDTLASYLG